jgi:hypothetical protein
VSNIETTLAERGARYGEFLGHAAITQALKSVMRGTLLEDLGDEKFVADLEAALAPVKAKWPTLRCDVREGWEMVAHKLGRSLNGDAEWAENAHDGAGYLTLVVKRQVGDQTPKKPGILTAAARTTGVREKR